MPTPTTRPSLTIDLAQRYATQPVGGAFDARNIIESGVDPLFASFQGAQFQTENGFATSQQQGSEEFKNGGANLSVYVQGLSTTPYGSAPKA